MEREKLLQTRRFHVERVRHLTADGELITREVVRHPGAAAIIPLVDNTHVCLIKNYRVSVNQTLIELPAGTLEPPEPPKITAARELVEETGYTAGELTALTSFYLAPGILDEQMHLFLAKGLTAGEAAREKGEQIENWVVSLDDAIAMVRDGTIQDAKTIIGLLTYERIRTEV